MESWIVIAMCGLYVCLEALVAFVFHKFHLVKSEGIRKFIHIATSFLIFPVIYGIKEPALRYVGPLFFVFFNAIASYGGMGRAIGLSDEKRHIGLVIYPLSVLFLVFLFNKGYMSAESAASGVLIMGLGDGMAALIGTKWGKHKYKVFKLGEKSVEGTFSMFVASFLVVYIISPCRVLAALFVALFSSLVENISPSGVDNATVPILSSLLLEVLCRL